MDITADAYMYAGVRMMGAVWKSLDHALLAAVVQLVGAGLGAWILSERWQRWRQRREFQHTMLVRFSESSERAYTILEELLIHRVAGKLDEPTRLSLCKEHLAMANRIAGMSGEAQVIFTDPQITPLLMGTQRILSSLAVMANAGDTPTPERFGPLVDLVLRLRDLVLVRMGGEMGFLPKGASVTRVTALEAEIERLGRELHELGVEFHV